MIRSLIRYLPESILIRLQNNPVYSRIAGGVFWSLVGSTLAQGLTILSSIPVARLLGSESYGGLGIIQSTVGTFVIFAGPALGVAATKHIAELRDSNSERTGNIIGMTSTAGLIASALMAIFLWVSAPFLASNTLNAPGLTEILRLASLVLFFNGLIGVQNGILSGFEAFRAMAVVNLWRGIISLPAMIVGAWFWHLPGAVLALGVTAVVTACVNQWAIQMEIAKHGVSVQYFALQSEWRILYGFSLPALLSSIVIVAATWSANALLVNQPNGYAEMGIFNAANQWRIAILFLPSVLSRPVLPMLSESLNRSLKDYKQILKLNIIITATVSSLLALIMVVASPWIMAAYGSDFARSWAVLAILAVSAALSAVGGVIGVAIWSTGKMWHGLVLNTAWAIVFLSTFYFTLHLGALGLSVAYLVAYISHLTIQAFYVTSMRVQLAP